MHLKPSMVTIGDDPLNHSLIQGGCPSSLVKLVQINSRVDGGYNYNIHGDYKPTYN